MTRSCNLSYRSTRLYGVTFHKAIILLNLTVCELKYDRRISVLRPILSIYFSACLHAVIACHVRLPCAEQLGASVRTVFYSHQQWCCFDDNVLLYCEVVWASELYSSFVILIGSSSLPDFVIGISNYLHVQLSITIRTNHLQYSI
jgi:hypothetical protein